MFETSNRVTAVSILSDCEALCLALEDESKPFAVSVKRGEQTCWSCIPRAV